MADIDGARIVSKSNVVTLVVSPVGAEPREATYFRSRAASVNSIRGTGYERTDFSFARIATAKKASQ